MTRFTLFLGIAALVTSAFAQDAGSCPADQNGGYNLGSVNTAPACNRGTGGYCVEGECFYGVVRINSNNEVDRNSYGSGSCNMGFYPEQASLPPPGAQYRCKTCPGQGQNTDGGFFNVVDPNTGGAADPQTLAGLNSCYVTAITGERQYIPTNAASNYCYPCGASDAPGCIPQQCNQQQGVQQTGQASCLNQTAGLACVVTCKETDGEVRTNMNGGTPQAACCPAGSMANSVGECVTPSGDIVRSKRALVRAKRRARVSREQERRRRVSL